MDPDTLADEWEILTGFLPPRWEELAWHTGAMKRSRKVKDPDTLLFLLMLHVAGGLSLRQAAARADQQGIASISDVALMKRLQKSETWLHELARRMFTDSRYEPDVSKTVPDHRVLVVDGTNIQEPGSTGTDWRLHYLLELPSLACNYVELTDQYGGETYHRVPVEPGDIVLGDRAYGHREAVAAVVDQDADVIVRLTWNGFPLTEPTGQAFDLFGHLRSLDDHHPAAWSVQFIASERRYDGRVCAIRRSQSAAEAAKERARKAGDPTPETLEAAEYVFVFTTLPDELLAPTDVLELFQARWQIELAFKRLKSLFGIGHVPKQNDRSARAWIYAKLLAVLMIERLHEAADFFPWGFELPDA